MQKKKKCLSILLESTHIKELFSFICISSRLEILRQSLTHEQSKSLFHPKIFDTIRVAPHKGVGNVFSYLERESKVSLTPIFPRDHGVGDVLAA